MNKNSKISTTFYTCLKSFKLRGLDLLGLIVVVEISLAMRRFKGIIMVEISLDMRRFKGTIMVKKSLVTKRFKNIVVVETSLTLQTLNSL